MSFIHAALTDVRAKLQDRVTALEKQSAPDATGIDAQLLGLCRDLDDAFDHIQTWAILIEMVRPRDPKST